MAAPSLARDYFTEEEMVGLIETIFYNSLFHSERYVNYQIQNTELQKSL